MLDYILDDIDRVLLLTVDPGYHSQPIITQAINKIKNLSSILNETGSDSVNIVVDAYH